MFDFKEELMRLLNAASKENGSETPDFVLATYLIDCLFAFDKATNRRDEFYKPSEASETPPEGSRSRIPLKVVGSARSPNQEKEEK